jgi:hypothetical protein
MEEDVVPQRDLEAGAVVVHPFAFRDLARLQLLLGRIMQR